jgi:WD40 repeat protein
LDFAFAGYDGKVWLGKLSENNQPEQNYLDIEIQQITAITFNSKGNLLAIASQNGQVQICDVQQKSCKKPLQLDINGNLNTITFTPENDFMVTGSGNGMIQFWNLDGQEIYKLPIQSSPMIETVTFEPKGNILAVAGGDGWIKFFDYQKTPENSILLNLKMEWNTEQNRIENLVFNNKSNLIATAGKDGTVKIWDLSDLNTPQLRLNLKEHQGEVNTVIFNNDSKLIATGGKDSMVRLWNEKGEELTQFTGHQGGVWGVTFDLGNQQLISAGEDGTVRAWDISEWQNENNDESFNLNNEIKQFFYGYGENILSLTQEGKLLIEKQNDKQSIELNNNQCNHHISNIDLTAKKEEFVTVNQNGEICYWNYKGQFHGKLSITELTQENIKLVKADQNRNRLVLVTEDNQIILNDNNSPKIFNPAQNEINDIIFNHNGETFATLSADNKVNFWDWSQKSFRDQLSDVSSLAFSPQNSPSQILVVGKIDGKIEIYNFNEINEKPNGLTEKHLNKVLKISFSKNGTKFLTAGDDGTVKLWDSSTQKKLVEIPSLGIVKNILFTKDNQLIITESEGGFIDFWDLKGRKVFAYQGYDLTLSANGNYFTVKDEQNKLKTYELKNLDKLIEEGCKWLEDYFKNNPQKSYLQKEICPSSTF